MAPMPLCSRHNTAVLASGKSRFQRLLKIALGLPNIDAWKSRTGWLVLTGQACIRKLTTVQNRDKHSSRQKGVAIWYFFLFLHENIYGRYLLEAPW